MPIVGARLGANAIHKIRFDTKTWIDVVTEECRDCWMSKDLTGRLNAYPTSLYDEPIASAMSPRRCLRVVILMM